MLLHVDPTSCGIVSNFHGLGGIHCCQTMQCTSLSVSRGYLEFDGVHAHDTDGLLGTGAWRDAVPWCAQANVVLQMGLVSQSNFQPVHHLCALRGGASDEDGAVG